MVEMFEGWDACTYAQLVRRYPTGSFVNAASDAGVGGGNCMRVGTFNFGGACYAQLPVTARSEYYLGFDFQTQGINGTFLYILNASGASIVSFSTVTGFGFTSSLGGTSPSAMFAASTWAQVKLHVVVSATVGVVRLLVDNVEAFNLTGLNTGTNDIARFQLYSNANVSNIYHYFDNLWVFNTTGSHSNGFPTGRMSVQTLLPTSDGSYADWTPDSGSTHYTRVNNATSDDDASYVAGTTIGHRDSYGMANLSGAISQVHGAKITAIHKKDDVPGKIMRITAKSGSTTAESSDINVLGTYGSTTLTLDDDPNTTAQWTESGINALEAGVKVVA